MTGRFTFKIKERHLLEEGYLSDALMNLYECLQKLLHDYLIILETISMICRSSHSSLSLLFKKVRGREHLFDIMAKRIGSYLGEGAC